MKAALIALIASNPGTIKAQRARRILRLRYGVHSMGKPLPDPAWLTAHGM